jgi:hypothetical protein
VHVDKGPIVIVDKYPKKVPMFPKKKIEPNIFIFLITMVAGKQ